jgi:methylmalonyl-CoA mutase cobalamin-binding subunit
MLNEKDLKDIKVAAGIIKDLTDAEELEGGDGTITRKTNLREAVRQFQEDVSESKGNSRDVAPIMKR